MPAKTIEALLKENRTFLPPAGFLKKAVVRDPKVYEKAAKNRLKFWEGFADRKSTRLNSSH